jgi:rod shape-determining protein MreB and related proteins
VGLFSRFSSDMGIDLGTANTLIYVASRGVVLAEPSVVAVDQLTRQPLAFGEAARQMLGRTPQSIHAIRPLRDGVIADFEVAELMLKHFIQQGHGGKYLVSPLIVISIPSGVTNIERRAVMEAASRAGAREVRLIEEPIAAAIGAGLPVTEPTGSMVIDIGGGTTEIAVLALRGIVVAETVRIAGDEMNEAISSYMKKVHNLIIGEHSAEQLKIQLGSAFPTRLTLKKQEVRGRHLLSGLPRVLSVRAEEVRESMSEPLGVIVESIKRILERTPPELAADIADRGIVLTGGGALLPGIDALITHETGIAAHIAEDPLRCVAHGIGKVLEEYQRFERTLSSGLERPTDTNG